MSDVGPSGSNPREPDPPDRGSTPSQHGVPGGRDAAPQGVGYANAVRPTATKLIEVSMFKSERTTKLQMTEEEHAKLVRELNIDPRKLYIIDDHEKSKIQFEVDANLDMSTISLHEAIQIRPGLRTQPIKRHAHMEFIKIYKTAARDRDDDIIRMLSPFGQVLQCTHQTYQPKRDSSQALKALVNVKKGDRDASARLHSFLPTWGILRDAEGNVIRKVKFTRRNQIKTCSRCGGKEKKSYDDDDSRICPAEGDINRCAEIQPDFEPSQEEIWDYWVSRAGNTGTDPQEQVLGQITADTVEVFNIHVEATNQELKDWLDSKDIFMLLDNIVVLPNPRKKQLKNLSPEVVTKLLEIDGSWMQYRDGTRSRLYMTALKKTQEDASAPPPGGGGHPPGGGGHPPGGGGGHPPQPPQPLPALQQQPRVPLPRVPQPSPPVSTSPASTSPPVSASMTSSSLTTSTPTTTTTTPSHSSSSTVTNPTSSTPEQHSDVQQQYEEAIRSSGKNRILDDFDNEDVNSQIIAAQALNNLAMDLFPAGTSTSINPLALPSVIPHNLSSIQAPPTSPPPTSSPGQSPSYSPPTYSPPHTVVSMEVSDDVPEVPPPESFTMDQVVEDLEEEEVPKPKRDPLSVSTASLESRKAENEAPPPTDPLSVPTASLGSRKTEENPVPTLSEIVQESLYRTIDATSTTITEGHEREEFLTTPLPSTPGTPWVFNDSSPSLDYEDLEQHGMRVKFTDLDKSNSSAGDKIPQNDKVKLLLSTSSSSSSSGGEEGDPSDGDSGLSGSRGSSSDSPQDARASLSPGTINPPTDLHPDHPGRTAFNNTTNNTVAVAAAVETSSAGDNASTFIDVNNINDTFDNLKDSDEESQNNTVIENIASITDISTQSVNNYINNKNSTDWPEYLRVVDLERRNHEMQEMLDHPERAPEIRARRKANEEFQKKYNPDGRMYGAIWCGDLRRRCQSESLDQTTEPSTTEPSTMSIGDDDEGYTPVTAGRRKRPLNLSSSPEDSATGQRRKPARKRTRSLNPNPEAIATRNSFQILADTRDGDTTDKEGDTTDKDGDTTGRPDDTVDLTGDDEDKEESPEVQLLSDDDVIVEGDSSASNVKKCL